MVSKLTIILFLVFCNSVNASEKSTDLVKQGNQALSLNDFAGALRKFNEAISADTKDIQAKFFKGVVLSRTGDFKKAMSLLITVEKAGFIHAQLDFELGLAHMNAGHFNRCIKHLERYESNYPGYGQASEFLGRCLLSIGQADKAEVALRKAVQIDSKLNVSVMLYLAMLEKSRNNLPAAQKNLEMAALPDGPLLRAWREWIVAPQAPPPSQPKFVSASLSTSMGFNDNVNGISDIQPLPKGIKSKSATYIRTNLNLSYTKKIDNLTSLGFGYTLLIDNYDNLKSSNLENYSVYTNIQKLFSPKSSLSLRLSNELTRIGELKLRSKVSIRPAYVHRFNTQSATETAITLADINYVSAISKPQSGSLNSIQINHYIFNKGKLQGFLNFSQIHNETNGSDYSYTSRSVSARLIHRLFFDVNGELGYSINKSDYRYNHSFFGYSRRDTSDTITLQLTRPISKNINIFFRQNETNNKSNIQYYSYIQRVTNIGIEASF